MFLGTHMQKLDDKGRLILPAKFREELSPGLVLTRGQENCLTLFPTTEVEAEHERGQNAPKTKKEAREYQRVGRSAARSSGPQRGAGRCRPDSSSPVARRLAAPGSPPRSSKPSTSESRARRGRIRKPAITSVCSCRRHLRTNRTNRGASRPRTYCGSTHH